MDNYSPDPFNNSENESENNSGYYDYDYYRNDTPIQNCPGYNTWLILSIMSAVLFNTLFGVLAIVFLFQANNEFRFSNYEKFESKIRNCKIFMVIAVVLGILNYAIYLPIVMEVMSSL